MKKVKVLRRILPKQQSGTERVRGRGEEAQDRLNTQKSDTRVGVYDEKVQKVFRIFKDRTEMI